MEIQLLRLPNKSLKLSDIKQLLIVLTESGGKEFGQVIAGKVCLCPRWPQPDDLKVQGLKSFQGLFLYMLGG